MTKNTMPNEGDDSNTTDEVKQEVASWMSGILGDVSKQSVVKQTLVGAASGSVAGYVCGKVGRMAAAGVGISVLLIQIAQHKGYIRINWKNVEKEIDNAKKSLSGTTQSSAVSTCLNESLVFVRSNVFLAAGFGSGFLIGLSM